MNHDMLYHGASAKNLESIKSKGILPRKMIGGRGNWEHTVQSNPNAVYITNCYAWHFAGAASEFDETGIIYEIDDTLLLPWLLCPDEDVLEQGTRTVGPTKDNPNFAQTDWDMKKRTRHYRKLAREMPHLAKQSLDLMGTAAYYGPIPWNYITRYATIEWPKLNEVIKWRALDSSVSVANYRFLKSRHEALMRWFFKEPVTVEELDGFAAAFKRAPAEDNGEFNAFKKHTDMLAEAMVDHSGITVHLGGAASAED
jgi:hypothetical protein